MPRGLRASPPKPTSVSPLCPSSAFTSAPTIPSNSISFCAYNTYYRKENNSSGPLWSQCPPFMWEGAAVWKWCPTPPKLRQVPDHHMVFCHAIWDFPSEGCHFVEKKKRGKRNVMWRCWVNFDKRKEELHLLKQWVPSTHSICQFFPV